VSATLTRARIITLANWNGEVPDSYVHHLSESGDPSHLYTQQNAGAVRDSFKARLEDDGEWLDVDWNELVRLARAYNFAAVGYILEPVQKHGPTIYKISYECFSMRGFDVRSSTMQPICERIKELVETAAGVKP